MVVYNFKGITVVPNATELIDICLSATQRKTPTVVHKGYAISRIRSFYMRKVKYTQSTIETRLTDILSGFPQIADIHPFYADLMNVLYDRDHYKLALAQINSIRGVISHLGQHYVRLLKYGESQYRCKQIKRAALGCMATTLKKLNSALKYLEQVRQHLTRLPSIDPTMRTLILCGYPNVGKSSLMNVLTRANVDVQPYAFTTKSLFVGHLFFKYFKWQVIDTPGILDHPLEERNIIEMMSITALAHLRSAVIFMVDVSQENEHSVSEQVSLFKSIKPLFSGKPLMLLLTKTDLRKSAELPESEQAALRELQESCPDMKVFDVSSISGEGVMEAKSAACEALLEQRVASKLQQRAEAGKGDGVLSRLHVAYPKPRDGISRESAIPESVFRAKENEGRPMDNDDLSKEQQNRLRKKKEVNIKKVDRVLEKDLCLQQGGPGVYNIDLRKEWDLKVDDWKYDVIPEIMDGKNLADFFTPDVDKLLDALEREEEERLAGRLDDDDEMDEEEMERHELAQRIREKKKIVVQERRLDGSKGRLPPRTMRRSADEFADGIRQLGGDATSARSHSVVQRRKRKRDEEDVDSMDVDASPLKRLRSRSLTPGREASGFKDDPSRKRAEKIVRKHVKRVVGRDGRAGVGDRSIFVKNPRHLVAGKRGSGKTDRR